MMHAHKKFDNWDQGVIAHLDHLALYAGASGYPKNIYQDKWIGSNLNNNETYDPRHFNYLHGKCKTVNSLGGNWAPSPTYGVEILNMYAEVVNLTVLYLFCFLFCFFKNKDVCFRVCRRLESISRAVNHCNNITMLFQISPNISL